MSALRRVPRGAWAILALALVVRLGATELLTDRFAPGADEILYIHIADSIGEGKLFSERAFVGGPSALVPPGFPYVLAAVEGVTGSEAEATRAFNSVLGTIAVALIGWLAWLIWARRDVALAAMGIAAVYPPLITLAAPLMTESWFIPLVLLAFAAALKGRQTGAMRWIALAGIAAGAATLFKSAGIVVPFLAAWIVWAPPRRTRAAVFAPAVTLGLAILIVAPWTIRNAVEFERLIPVSNELGFGMGGVYNQTAFDDPDEVWIPPQFDPEYESIVTDSTVDEAEMSRELQSRSLEFLADHPSYPLEVAFDNTVSTLALNIGGPTQGDPGFVGFAAQASETTAYRVLYRANQLGFLVVLVLAIASVATGRARAFPRPLLGFVAIIVLGYLFLVSGMRFRLPADPIVILLAAPAVVALLERFRQSTHNDRRAPVMEPASRD